MLDEMESGLQGKTWATATYLTTAEQNLKRSKNNKLETKNKDQKTMEKNM